AAPGPAWRVRVVLLGRGRARGARCGVSHCGRRVAHVATAFRMGGGVCGSAESAERAIPERTRYAEARLRQTIVMHHVVLTKVMGHTAAERAGMAGVMEQVVGEVAEDAPRED